MTLSFPPQISGEVNPRPPFCEINKARQPLPAVAIIRRASIGGLLGIKAVSFDFWHTLFTESGDAFSFYGERRRKLLTDALAGYGSFSAVQIHEASRAEAELHDMVWRQPHPTLPVAERIGTILNHLEVRVPEDVTMQIARAYEEGLLERPPTLVPGARDAVERLSTRYRLGIISDVGFAPGRVLKQVLGATGL